MTLDWRKLQDFIFPPSEDELLIRAGNFLPTNQRKVSHDTIALCDYREKTVKASVHLAKFHNHQKAKELLAEVWSDYIRATTEQRIIIIPVPLSAKRMRQRGYNQVNEVLKLACNDLPNVQIYDNILVRHIHTQPQTSLSRTKRLENMHDAFKLKNEVKAKKLLAGENIFLVDDVSTTGATLKAAGKPLKVCRPASLTNVALAH